MEDIQNTWSMCMAPQPRPDYDSLDSPASGSLSLMPVMTGELFLAAVNYPVIVEMWQKAKAGRGKRAWLAQFTQAERNKIGRYYGRFHRWHLISGAPAHVSCRLSTVELLQRAAAFFASI